MLMADEGNVRATRGLGRGNARHARLDNGRVTKAYQGASDRVKCARFVQ